MPYTDLSSITQLVMVREDPDSNPGHLLRFSASSLFLTELEGGEVSRPLSPDGLMPLPRPEKAWLHFTWQSLGHPCGQYHEAYQMRCGFSRVKRKTARPLIQLSLMGHFLVPMCSEPG